MFKLNNRGWGLGTMIAFVCVFLLAIILITVISLKYGFTNKTNSTRQQENSRNNTTPVDTAKYQKYEQEIRQKADIYYKNNSNSSVESPIYINIQALDIKQEIKNQCTGYAEITVNEQNQYYNAYIKCTAYETVGYDESHLR